MSGLSKGQFAAGGFGFLVVWVFIMSQKFSGAANGFNMITNPYFNFDEKLPVFFLTALFLGLSFFCFFQALKDKRD